VTLTYFVKLGRRRRKPIHNAILRLFWRFYGSVFNYGYLFHEYYNSLVQYKGKHQ